MNDRWRGVLLAAGGMATLSTDSLFIRLADAGTYDVVFWIGLLTALVLLVGPGLVAPSALRRQLVEHGRAVVLLGVLQATMLLLFVVAVQNTSIANVVVILAAAPLAGALFGWLLLRERPAPHVWVAMAVTAVGVAIVVTGSAAAGGVVGVVGAIGAIVAFALASVVLRRRPDVSRPLVVGLGGALLALVALPQASLTGHSAKTWFALVAMGAVVGPLARVLITSAPRYLPAAEVGLFAPVETVLATVWAFLAFGETPAARTWIGGVVILAAVAYGVWPRSASPSRLPERERS